MVDLVKEVGISHSCATNHDSVCTDFFDTLFGFLNRTDVTVGDEWNFCQCLGYVVQGLEVSMPCVHLLTGATVHGQS